MNAPNITLELDLARNMFGKLKAPIRKRILALVNNPCQETWQAAHSIIVGCHGWMTLWQAVCELDRSFLFIGPTTTTDDDGAVLNRTPWKQIPSADLIVRALRFATH